MKQGVLLCIFSLLLLTTGCRTIGGGIRIDAGYPYGHPAPPAHAPAHGRRHHLYHYYPNAEFYFDVHRNMYFYLDTRGRWTFSVNLPHHLHGYLDSGFVEFEMENDRPYLKHQYHKRKYKKHKYKYHKKKYRNKPNTFLGDEDHRSRHKNEKYKKENKRYKNDKYKHKEERRKKEDRDEDDEQRHHKGRGFLGN